MSPIPNFHSTRGGMGYSRAHAYIPGLAIPTRRIIEGKSNQPDKELNGALDGAARALSKPSAAESARSQEKAEDAGRVGISDYLTAGKQLENDPNTIPG